MSLKDQAVAVGRITVAAILTSIVIVMFLTLAFSGQTKNQQEIAETLVRTNQAVACELALPVTDKGRDPELVKLCFTQYGLLPPSTLNP